MSHPAAFKLTIVRFILLCLCDRFATQLYLCDLYWRVQEVSTACTRKGEKLSQL